MMLTGVLIGAVLGGIFVGACAVIAATYAHRKRDRQPTEWLDEHYRAEPRIAVTTIQKHERTITL